MTAIVDPSRRMLLGVGVGLVATGAFASRALAKSAPTAEQELGPFFPVVRPLDQDNDLTRVKGSSGIARGQIIDVFGRVMDSAGKAVPRARIDIWQANAIGRYMHPADMRADAPLDPNFQGSAVILADDEGNYRFRTVRPGSYPIGGGRVRTPHIHADVTGRSNRLTTQMYFPNEPLNDKDILFPSADPRESVIARAVGPVSGDPGALGFAWDIILAVG